MFRCPISPHTLGAVAPSLFILLLAGPNLLALGPADIPTDAPDDAVMARPAEIEEMQDWASTVFAGRLPPGHAPAVRVMVRRQDYSCLRFGQSCIETPIEIGKRKFKHGLGTHANSELVLHLPPDAKEFKAFVGIDNNPDTGGVLGSVQFSVEIAGSNVFRTPVIRGTNPPTPVKIALPDGTRELTLKVDATADGPSNDQADWADACIITGDGQLHWADAGNQPFTRTTRPFSFRYGGAGSSTFLAKWQRAAETTETPTRVIHQASWTDPNTSLRVSATATAFKRYPAVEWVLEFENLGTQDTPCSSRCRPSMSNSAPVTTANRSYSTG